MLSSRSIVGSGSARAGTLRPQPFGARPAGRRACVRVAAASAAELQAKFGIAGSVEVVEGKSGQTAVKLTHSSGTTAEVYLFGANVTSWAQPSGDEVLYVRPDAVFDRSKPISGGIPICFPQFGPGAIQQHGFARNLDWDIASTSADLQPDEKDPEVELVLTENDYTTAIWPYKFKAAYSVSLHGEELRTEFRVINTDSKPFDFTAGLHTYIEVADVTKASVTGLKGLTYLDKSGDANNPASKKEERDAVTFGEALVDSVYLDAPEHSELNVGTGAAVAVQAKNWPDVVVWNPFLTMKACYQEFVCLENAVVAKPVVLQPGESWIATTTHAVVDL